MSFGPKTLAEAKACTYGSIYRRKYDPKYCAASVHEPGRGGMFHQCGKRTGFGPEGIFCKIHDPAAEQARRDKSQAKHERESARRNAIYSAPAKLEKAEKRIAALERRNAELVTALEEAMRVFDELDAVSWFPDSDIGPQTYAEAERLGAAALAQPATTQAHE